MKKGAMGVVVLIALAVIGQGCGDDSTASGGSSAEVTKAQFLKEGNATCRQGEAKRLAAMTAVGETLDLKEDVTKNENGDRLVLAGVAAFKEMTEELAELEPPAGEEEAVEDVIAKMEKSIERAEAKPKEVFNENVVFGPAEEAFNEYGLTDCLG